MRVSTIEFTVCGRIFTKRQVFRRYLKSRFLDQIHVLYLSEESPAFSARTTPYLILSSNGHFLLQSGSNLCVNLAQLPAGNEITSDNSTASHRSTDDPDVIQAG